MAELYMLTPDFVNKSDAISCMEIIGY